MKKKFLHFKKDNVRHLRIICMGHHVEIVQTELGKMILRTNVESAMKIVKLAMAPRPQIVYHAFQIKNLINKLVMQSVRFLFTRMTQVLIVLLLVQK